MCWQLTQPCCELSLYRIFETRLLSDIPNLKPLERFRNVDDIFVISPTQNNPKETLNAIYTTTESSQFTLETKTDSCIHLLDVLVKKNTHIFQYSVYAEGPPGPVSDGLLLKSQSLNQKFCFIVSLSTGSPHQQPLIPSE